jgi:hypothetical protein
MQRGLRATETWYERWNIKFNEDKTQATYFSHRLRLPEAQFTLNGQNIPFVNSAKYLDVTFDTRNTWRLYIEMIETKAYRTFIRFNSLLKS